MGKPAATLQDELRHAALEALAEHARAFRGALPGELLQGYLAQVDWSLPQLGRVDPRIAERLRERRLQERDVALDRILRACDGPGQAAAR